MLEHAAILGSTVLDCRFKLYRAILMSGSVVSKPVNCSTGMQKSGGRPRIHIPVRQLSSLLSSYSSYNHRPTAMSFDAFEARLQFLQLLRKLNASAQSIQKVVGFAVKYGAKCGEDLWEVVMDECEKVGPVSP